MATIPTPMQPVPARASRALLRFWSSTGVGIGLMLAIAAASILGTIVPQGDPTALDHLQLSEPVRSVLSALDATNVYASGWFLVLLGLFFLNLLVSTVRVVLPRLQVALRLPPEVPLAAQANHPVRLFVQTPELARVASALRARGYRVFEGKGGGLVAHKGRWSRLSALVTHVGLFILLLSALFTGLTAIKSRISLMPGESMPVQQVVGDFAQRRGPLAPDKRGWGVRLDKFWMEHYDPDTVKQFYSDLSIVRDGRVVAQKRIWVNEPFTYDGIWFYQSFWGLGGLDLSIGGKPQRVELRDGKPMGLKGSFTRPVTIGKGQYILYLGSERMPLILMKVLAGGSPQPVAQMGPGQTMTLEGTPFRYEGPAYYSGLQAKSDAGIPGIYTGFGVIILGTALAFFSLRQVWANPVEGGFLLSGRSNRGSDGLLRELSSVVSQCAPVAVKEGLPS
ncbi:MAG TPA: cytochrome c biogenesis protein ResB [Stenomitos sp.]